MATNRQQIQQYIRDFNFQQLFVHELGWDHLNEPPLTIPCDGQTYTLRPLVEKRGVKVYVCDPDAQGKIPADPILRKIEREVTRHAYEHFIIYVDAARRRHVWQWVKREQGKPLAPRLNRYYKGQSGELLAQKLEVLSIAIDEEETLHMTEVAGRVAKAFDVERVTKKFYDRFKLEHATFLNFIQGISSQADREWYASLMLNRLMFIYFIQRKGFLDTKTPGLLDGDANYLSNRLKWVQEQRGEDQFHTFYRYFLIKLFHDGLSKREHSPELEALLGKVPYLNGGLFDVHVLERDYPQLNIPDEAFQHLFDFFDDFDWHLDDRPLRNDREINPDILGYIFEKYINQKQMGAYYTKEDITEYISKNTIIPYIFEAAEQKCMIAFEPDGPIWSLLRENPDRYIYDAVRKGCDVSLPSEIAVGEQDIAQRGEWNKPATDAYALPTEIWREVVARRNRYHEVRAKLAAGEISSINDLITYNLDIRQFAQDAIAYCEGTDLLRAFYESIESVTVLDPTCGSGAFLFAALGILEALYEACLDRMQAMIEERDQLDVALPAQQRQQHPALDHFRRLLREVGRHPSRIYFIYKSIIINNLYGVDIMEEATEICKLRLFLKLVSQVNTFDDIEPLPDIDFNIRAGNTLVGFASYEETKKAIEGKTTGKGTTRDEVAFQNQMIFDDRLARIEQRAQEIERAFDHFRKLQTQLQLEASDMAENKQHLREKLEVLRAELNSYLASEYGIDRNNITKTEVYDEKLAQWQRSHQPFHWWIEFYGIMKRGGFDVIIGNPPYVEKSKFKQSGYTIKGFLTEQCSDLYAVVVERSLRLSDEKGVLGLIVPISIACTDDFAPLQKLLITQKRAKWMAHFANRPSQLFTGAQKRLTILVFGSSNARKNVLFTSRYKRWFKEERDYLIATNEFTCQTDLPIVFKNSIAKIGSYREICIVKKALASGTRLGNYIVEISPYKTYYVRTPGYFCQFWDKPPMVKVLKSSEKRPRGELYSDSFKTEDDLYICLAVLNSSLFYWYIFAYSDCRHMNRRDVLNFPLNLEMMDESTLLALIKLSHELQIDYQKNKSIMLKSGLEIEIFEAAKSKPLIDQVDRILAQHYGFTDEELDFIINYDIKYRMGRDNGDESEV